MPASPDAELLIEQRGPILILTINRPHVRNALNRSVMAGIGGGIARASGSPGTGAIVLTAAGDRAFSAGMDLKEYARRPRSASVEDRSDLDAFHDWLSDGCEMPVIGAANGAAVAGGFEVLLACDLVVAAVNATFGLPEVQRGLVAGGGGVELARRIPVAKALELTLTGDSISAEEAAALGLVNRVVPAAQVLDVAVTLAERIVANGPQAVRSSKRLVWAALRETDRDFRPMKRSLVEDALGSEEAREGAVAFVEKRRPRWRRNEAVGSDRDVEAGT